jgi:hypothetical protein
LIEGDVVEIADLGNRINEEIQLELDNSGGLYLRNVNVELRVVGQTSLLLNKELSCKIQLNETRDFDSFVFCEMQILEIVKKVIKEFNMYLDPLSNEIWMPSETTYTNEYDEGRVKIFIAKPVYVLTSKAIKAKLKNKELIKEAMTIYGNELESLIVKYGGKSEDFK